MANDFDGAVRGALHDYEAAPAGEAWALISARLPEATVGRKPVGAWLVGLVAALVLGVGVFVEFGKSPSPRGQSLQGHSPVAFVAHGNPPSPPYSVDRAPYAPHTSPDRQNKGGGDGRASGAAMAGDGSAESGACLPPCPATTPTDAQRKRAPSLDKGGRGGYPPLAQHLSTSLSATSSRTLNLPPLRQLVLGSSHLSTLADPGIPCPTFGQGRQWLFNVRATVGPGIVDRDFDTAEPELRGYARLRDSVEERQLQPRAGLYLEAVHKSGLFVRAGADYRMYRSNVTAMGPQTQTTTLTEVRDPISGALIRTDTSVVVTSTTSTVYNRVQTITPVVGLGFQYTVGSVTPYVLAQAGYEFTVKGRGTVPNPFGLPVDLNERDGYIAAQPGLQYGGVAGFDVSLTNQWAVGLSVEFLKLGALRGPDEPLDYGQTVVTPGLNAVYRF